MIRFPGMTRSAVKLRLHAFRLEECGAAAVEMALISTLFVAGILNAAEMARYGFQMMELQAATQAGAQATLVTCDTSHLPATVNCANVVTAVTTAIHGTSLGTKVTLSGSLSEAYYCLNAAGALVWVSTTGSKPADCTAAGTPALKPADYAVVNTTFVFSPLFRGATVVSSFPSTLNRSAWMRLG